MARRIEGYWEVPRMWEGATVALLGTGPSAIPGVATVLREFGVPTIAINCSFRLAPWAQLIYAADAEWWRVYGEEVQRTCPNSLRATCSMVSGRREGVQQPLLLKVLGLNGLSTDPQGVYTGSNSGYQALNIAVLAGARRVLLCGFDHKGGHWHGKYPSPLRNAGEGIFEKWMQKYQALAPLCKKAGVEVINCTPDSALRVWPVRDLQEVLSECFTT